MAKNISARVCRQLEKVARAAAKKSYSPYSEFPVGAAVLAASGKIYAGCNVENASYGLCNCAERTAIFTAAAAGERRILAVAVFTPTAQPTSPCGACRQVMAEFGNFRILSATLSGEVFESTVDNLLPRSHTGILDLD